MRYARRGDWPRARCPLEESCEKSSATRVMREDERCEVLSQLGRAGRLVVVAVPFSGLVAGDGFARQAVLMADQFY